MRDKQRKLREIAKQASENGSSVVLKSYSIKLDGIEYTVNDIAYIPVKYTHSKGKLQHDQKQERKQDQANKLEVQPRATSSPDVSQEHTNYSDLMENDMVESEEMQLEQENTDPKTVMDSGNNTENKKVGEEVEVGTQNNEGKEKEKEHELGKGKGKLYGRNLTDILGPIFIILYGMVLGFCSRHAFLSNFFEAPIRFNGKKHKTNEHAYQYEKAIICKDPTAAREVLKAKTAKDAKDATRGVISNSTWNMLKKQRMAQINRAKYTQNLGLAKRLLDTFPYQLAEMTRDPYWGTGSFIRSEASKNGTWTGQNGLGKILMALREDLRREVESGKLKLPA